jgi:hypothetical protein
MVEFKTTYQLEAMVAEIAGFDPKNVQVSRAGNKGDWRANFVGTVAAVTASRAQHDVEAACSKLKAQYLLKD